MGAAGAAWVRAALLAGVVVAADQVTKRMVESDIELGHGRDGVAFLDLVHVRNNGVAFGLLSGGGTALVVALTLGALVAVLIWFAREPARPLAWVPTGLLVGGALGNLIDRVRQGSVTDFLKIPHWPAFNLADAAITVGVVTLVIALETRHSRT
ncbi:MAG: signal peptidase II [Solirubrobacteraceae bacterium]